MTAPALSRTPRWVWLLAAALAATQPLLIYWLIYFPPAGTTSSGLTIPDSAIFIQAMDLFAQDYASPYALHTPGGASHALALYPMPYLWVYGMLGAAARALGLSHLVAYGWANGFAAFAYLCAAYFFLREAAPRVAARAFLLFALSGGPGGLLYVFTGLMGWHGAPGFDEQFFRYALYELVEGAHLLPMTYFPRLYYTSSLALCFSAMALLLRHRRVPSRHGLPLAALCLASGAFINPRFGVFTAAILALYAWRQPAVWKGVALTACAGLLGWATAWRMMQASPVVIQNHVDTGDMAMWLSPFISAALLHLFLFPQEIRRAIPRLSPLERIAACLAICYVMAFTAFFVLHQAYYGNLQIARDGSLAARVSDPALALGIALALAWLWWRRLQPAAHPGQAHDEAPGWIVLWLLAFLAMALSGFGHGWFLRFGPQRLMVFLWLPLCILSAYALERMQAQHPQNARRYMLALLGCGALSILAGFCCFQGPLGRVEAKGPYPQYHAEIITQSDARVIGQIGEGRVLAPALASDAVVRLHGNPVFFGIGSFNLADEPYVFLRDRTAWFFSPEPSMEERRQFILEWGIRYVFYPETEPIDGAVLAQLRQIPWLLPSAQEGNSVLFEVGEGLIILDNWNQ